MCWKRLDHDKRVQLAALLNAGHSKKEMAAMLGCHLSTIYRELKKGACKQLDSEYREYTVYSPYAADARYRQAVSNCGVSYKLDDDDSTMLFIQKMIMLRHYSPAAVAVLLRRSGMTYICEDTIYRYIKHKRFSRLRSAHLPEHGKRKHPVKQETKEKKSPLYGTSIEKRPPAIGERLTFGHWEMDSVVGKKEGKNETFVVMSERLTRAELVFKVPDKSAASVVAVLDRLQRGCAFRQIFKSITMDNGSEFSNAYRMEYSRHGRRRTYTYYCHPYTSCERGTNENLNRMIRRWYPKGRSLCSVTPSDALHLSAWMNTYPRGVLGWKTASERFKEECEKEGIKITPYLSQFLS